MSDDPARIRRHFYRVFQDADEWVVRMLRLEDEQRERRAPEPTPPAETVEARAKAWLAANQKWAVMSAPDLSVLLAAFARTERARVLWKMVAVIDRLADAVDSLGQARSWRGACNAAASKLRAAADREEKAEREVERPARKPEQ